MRDPKRIDLVLQAIKELWIEMPDLRLMHLLDNVTNPKCIFNATEDDELLSLLIDFKDKHVSTIL